VPARQPRIAADGPRPPTEFTALYDGDCVCGAPIYEGDVVAYIDGDLSCQDCIRDYLHTC
jgi:hypothetical protein